MHYPTSYLVAPSLLSALTAAAHSNIAPDQKLGWGENVGWLNFYDANGAADGVHVRATFLRGFIWAENVGWINVGNGHPVNGIHYSNDPGDASTFGINIDPTSGDLFGMAWGENIGWVNFDTRAALGPHGQQARFDFVAGRFRGYCWGENLGWINLDDAATFVGITPPVCNSPFADADGDGDSDQTDFGVFQRCVSGSGVPAPAGCECFDRPAAGFPHGDNDIDGDDLADFEKCASGPAIPANITCDDEP